MPLPTLVAGPARGLGGVGREVGDVDPPEHPEVVVAGQADVAVLGGHLDALVGERAVADEVAQEPDAVEVLGLHGIEHRPERRQVAVHV